MNYSLLSAYEEMCDLFTLLYDIVEVRLGDRSPTLHANADPLASSHTDGNSPCNFEDDLGNEIEESHCVSLQVPFRRKLLINTHDTSAVILHMCRVGENMCCLMCEFPPAMLNFCSLCILWVEIW